MVFCVVCTRTTPPLLTLNDEEMSIYEIMVSPFINLELLIKSHTILVCSTCKGQIDQMQHFRAIAVAGARHLQDFLMDFDSNEAMDRAEGATIQHEPEYKTESETALQPKIEEEPVECILKIKLELERQEELCEENDGGSASEAAAAVDAPGDSGWGSGALTKSPSNEAETAVSRHEPDRRLTNGSSGDTAAPSTSGAQTRIQASGISKRNMYDPKFLNKYFSKALSQTNKPEPDVVPNDPKSAEASPRRAEAAPEASGGTSTANARSRRALRITSETRRRIIELNHAGLNVTDIADELGISRNTVKLWLKRWELEGHLRNHVSQGRPRCTSVHQDIKMLKKAREHRSLNTTLFAEDFGMSPATIRRRFAEAGLRNIASTKKPKLSSRHKTQRLQFAAENIDTSFDDVIFMDEKVFCSNDNGNLSLLRPGNIASKYKTPDGDSGPVTVCFWGWMCASGPGELVEIPGRMNSVRYRNILQESFLPTAEVVFPNQNITFVHNVSAFHNSRFVETWIKEQSNLTLLKMPPHSPDLNPIENLWGKIVREWDPTPTQHSNIDALRAHIVRMWESFRGQNFCKDLVGSMGRRLQDVLNAQGGYTKH